MCIQASKSVFFQAIHIFAGNGKTNKFPVESIDRPGIIQLFRQSLYEGVYISGCAGIHPGLPPSLRASPLAILMTLLWADNKFTQHRTYYFLVESAEDTFPGHTMTAIVGVLRRPEIYCGPEKAEFEEWALAAGHGCGGYGGHGGHGGHGGYGGHGHMHQIIVNIPFIGPQSQMIGWTIWLTYCLEP